MKQLDEKKKLKNLIFKNYFVYSIFTLEKKITSWLFNFIFENNLELDVNTVKIKKKYSFSYIFHLYNS